MNQLTKTEEHIMKYLWKIKKGYMKDIVDEFPDPKPAYTTSATILTRMVEKGYVGFNQHGKVREYFPILKKSKYFKSHINQLVNNFFNNSTAQFASFFTTKTDMTVEELEELRDIIDQQIKNKKA